MSINWQQMQHIFEPDGSFRDLYVLETNLCIWRAFLDQLRSSDYSLQYEGDGEARSLPEQIEAIFQLREQASTCLGIRVGELLINCHFFTDAQLELDIDPREVRDESTFAQLLSFMRTLGRWLTRDVLLTLENSPELVLAQFSAADDGFSPGAFQDWSPLLS